MVSKSLELSIFLSIQELGRTVGKRESSIQLMAVIQVGEHRNIH